MKFLVLTGLVLTAIISASHQNQFAAHILKNYFTSHEEVKRHCLLEIPVNKKLESVFEETGEMGNNENLNCFIKCIYITAGIINNEGKLLLANIQQMLNIQDTQFIDEFNEKCSDFPKSDLCEGSKQLSICGLQFLESHKLDLV